MIHWLTLAPQWIVMYARLQIIIRDAMRKTGYTGLSNYLMFNKSRPLILIRLKLRPVSELLLRLSQNQDLNGKIMIPCERFQNFTKPFNGVAPFSAFKPTHTSQFLQSLWQRANARNVSLLTLYGGQFTFSTQLLTLNYLLYSPADAAPQFL